MADKPLKSITFPGLADKYTIPEIDSTLTQQGEAADAKKTGDEISDVKNTLSHKADVIYDTASGDIASFPDGADGLPVKDLTVGIEPIQNLHGYDNPWPAGGGKNLFDISDLYASATYDGVTVTKDTDRLHVTGEAATPGNFAFYDFSLATGSYYFSSESTGLALLLLKGYSQVVSGNGSFTVDDATATYRLAVSKTVGVEVNYYISKIQIESGTSKTSYAPYSNICPISGWTGANVSRTGKNLLRWYAEGETKTQASVTGTVQADGGVKLTGTASGTWWGFGDSPTCLLKAGTYTLNQTGTSSGGIQTILVDHENNTVILGVSGTSQSASFALSSDTVVHAYNKVSSGTATECTIYIWVELGSTVTSYEPYTGATIPISWQSSAGTVYGGTLDVTSGVLTVNYAMDEFDGSSDENWAEGTTDIRKMFSSHISKNKKATTEAIDLCLSNSIPLSGTNYATGPDNDRITCRSTTYVSNNFYVFAPPSLIADVSGLETYLANQPLQFYYPLATPLVIQLDPVTVTTILGQNNIWADCGPSTVEYPADTKLYIDKKLAALVAALS